MKGREFILGSAAAAWPVVARAQQPDRVRRIGVLMNVEASDQEGQNRLSAFQQGLEKSGWSVGRNVRVDYRWGANKTDRNRGAAELVSLAPDVILAGAASVLVPLQQATRSIPIVFVQVTDPVGAGFVESLARPGGNITGFSLFEFGISSKWLEQLKEISPNTKRVGVLRDRTLPAAVAQFSAIQSVAPSFGINLTTIDPRDAADIEQGVGKFASVPNGGLIMTVSGLGVTYSKLIAELAARFRLPAIYPFRFHVLNGGLMSFGPDPGGQFRRASEYVDRILKGEKPSDLPVQQPTKYELVINLKTANALGLTVPPTLLARADEVIE